MNPNFLLAARSGSKGTEEYLVHFLAGRLDEAEYAVRQGMVLRPRNPDLHYNLGTILAAAGRHDEAADEFRCGLDIRPQDAAALNNLGNSLVELDRFEEAEAAFAKALKYDRNNPVIRANRAGVLNRLAAGCRNQGREAAARPLLELAIELNPDLAEAWNNLGTVLHDLGELEEGERSLRRALLIRDDYPLAIGNLGNLLLDQGRFAEALACYESAVARAPESPVARWNLALALLAAGDLKRGFAEFEWRMQLPEALSFYANRGAPNWQGEALSGRSLLLFAEQGLGDTLQFVRYLPLLAERGGRIFLECQRPLIPLLKGLPGLDGIAASGESDWRPDFVCPLMSLPTRFGTTIESIPADVPYLHADPARAERWAGSICRQPRRPRVGLVWAGEPRPEQPNANRIDRRRSLRLDDFAPLLELGGIEFHSLQKGVAAAQLSGNWVGRIADWGPRLTDFAETSALVSHLDLVIGVDTSVVHLAAAMAKPTWVLSRFDGCWRWLRDREDSPWYPTLRLFRQPRPRDWAPVIAAVQEHLVLWAEGFDGR